MAEKQQKLQAFDSGYELNSTMDIFGDGTSLESQGYDNEFVPGLDPKYECPICLSGLRDPYQTSCGHRFCKGCLFKWIRGSEETRCPIDNEPILETQLFPDNFAKREILSLTIKCSNNAMGCQQIVVLRKLQEHLDKCEFSAGPCPNGCSAILIRRELQHHLLEECVRRRVRCAACRQDVIFEEYKIHMEECPLVQVKCRFCDVKLMREQMRRHIDLDCPRAVIKCTFSIVGCEIEVERSGLALHMQEYTQPHLRMLVTSYGDVLKFIQSQQGMSSIGPLEAPAPPLPHKQPTSKEFQRTNSQTNPKIREIEELYSNFPEKGGAIFKRHSAGAMTSMGAAEVSMLEFETLKERNTYQDQKLSKQDQQILELQAKNRALENVVTSQKRQLRQQEDRLHDLDARSCNGVYIWKVNNYSTLRREAQNGDTTVIHSPGFYTSYYGYKLCIRMNLNGVDNAHGTHLSVFIHFMQGEYDYLLDWPFHGKITLSILDQTEVCELRQNVIETLASKPNLAAFQKPTTHRNHKGFGYMEFAPLSLLESGRYIKDDTLIVKADVKVEPHH